MSRSPSLRLTDHRDVHIAIAPQGSHVNCESLPITDRSIDFYKTQDGLVRHEPGNDPARVALREYVADRVTQLRVLDLPGSSCWDRRSYYFLKDHRLNIKMRGAVSMPFFGALNHLPHGQVFLPSPIREFIAIDDVDIVVPFPVAGDTPALDRLVHAMHVRPGDAAARSKLMVVLLLKFTAFPASTPIWAAWRRSSSISSAPVKSSRLHLSTRLCRPWSTNFSRCHIRGTLPRDIPPR